MAKDVIELLVKDHREAEELIEKIEGTTDTATRQQLAQTLVEELMRHAKAEEQVMYPAAREALEDGAERIAEAKEEHQQVEGLLARLEKLDPGDAAFDETVTELRTAIEHHVEEEEGELFPEFEDRVERDRRTEMGRQFEEAKTKAPTSPSAGPLRRAS